MDHGTTTKQLMVFQREMPDLTPTQPTNGENGPDMSSSANSDRNGTKHLPPLLNIREAHLSEAELAFKEICSDLEDDKSTNCNDQDGSTPEIFEAVASDSNVQRDGDLDFFWDGRYHQTSYIRQRDIFDDGEPPPPRSGWPIQQLNLRCIVKDLEHPPLMKGQNDMVYFSLELHLGDQVYKSPVCAGDATQGFVRFDQLFSTHIDDDVLEAVSASLHNSTPGPVLTAIVYDCGRRFKNTVVGHVSLSVADLLEIHQEGWHSLVCKLVDSEGRDVMGCDGKGSTIAMAFDVDERCKIQWMPPTLEKTLEVCEGPLKLQAQGRRRTENMSRSLVSMGHKEPADKAHAASTRDILNSDSFAMGILSPAIGESKTEPEMQAELAELEYLEADEEKQEEIFYWREWLEGWIDGIAIQIFIISLVLLDLILLVVYTFILPSDDGGDASISDHNNKAQVSSVATVVILACFVFELTLRHVAKGYRFVRDKWCIFDFVVIWLSVIMVVVRQTLTVNEGSTQSGENLQTANSSTNALRILSRVAQGLRLLRVLINLRHARALSGKVQGKLRGLVSQNRRRFLKYGFDLDCTYITNRVIAMSAPVFGRHSSYRNDIHVVSRFLAYMHYGNFFVANLCDTYYSSDRLIGQYHPGMLFNQVQRIPVEDHCPPLLLEVVRFCEDVAAWMRRDSRNVIAVHCKGGKGRTGVFVSAFLLWSGHRRTALDALELFTFRRTEDYQPELGLDSSLSHGVAFKQSNQTVEGPSQIRYVHYVEAVLYSGINPASMPKMALLSLTFNVGPRLRRRPWFMSFSISCLRAPVLDSRNVCNTESGALIGLGTTEAGADGWDSVEVPVRAPVWGDVRLDFYRYDSPNAPNGSRRLAFQIGFHTAFYGGRRRVRFTKRKLDILCKDHKDKLTDGDFAVELELSEDPKLLEQMHYEERFTKLCHRIGTRVTFQPGETILQLGKKQDSMYLLESGTAEGVVDERFAGGPHHSHQLGRCIGSGSDGTSGGTAERVPFVCMLGSGGVVGPGLFLAHMDTMKYRARTQVTAIRVDRNMTGKKNLWRSVRLLVNKATESDHKLEGLESEDLADFYRGLAVKLATQLSRVQAEVIRVGSLRAFSDRQTVMIEVDEGERVRAECIRRFALPMNERLLLKAKCHYMRGSIAPAAGSNAAALARAASSSAARRSNSLDMLASRVPSAASSPPAPAAANGGAPPAAALRRSKLSRGGGGGGGSGGGSGGGMLGSFLCSLGIGASGAGSSSGVGPNGVPLGSVNMRLILLANYLVLDPAFYGPTVSASAICFPCSQLASVTPPDARSPEPKTVVLSTFCKDQDRVDTKGRKSGERESWTSKYEVQAHKLTFDAVSRSRQVYTALSSMCQEGEKVRDRDAVPFLDALASCDIARHGVEHKLRLGQRLSTASNVDSLFAIQTGQVKVIDRSTGKVFQVVREGQILGLVEFTLRVMPGHYFVEATMVDTVVLELKHQDLQRAFEDDVQLCVRFYGAVCYQLTKDKEAFYQDAFPGTWNRRHYDDDPGMEGSFLNPDSVSPTATADLRASINARASVDRSERLGTRLRGAHSPLRRRNTTLSAANGGDLAAAGVGGPSRASSVRFADRLSLESSVSSRGSGGSPTAAIKPARRPPSAELYNPRAGAGGAGGESSGGGTASGDFSCRRSRHLSDSPTPTPPGSGPPLPAGMFEVRAVPPAPPLPAPQLPERTPELAAGVGGGRPDTRFVCDV